MMRNKSLMMLVLVFAMLSTVASAATMFFNCNIAGAKLQVYNDNIRDWDAPISFPYTRVEPRYTLLLLKVTAIGYEDFERGYEATSYPQMFTINLEPSDATPAGVPLFGWAGQIVSKRGLVVMPNAYRVIMRNLTSYKKTDAPQVSQEITTNAVDGNFSCCLANFSTIRNPNGSAAIVGDRVYVGAFNSSMTVCYGYKIKTLTEDDVSDAGIYMNIFVR